MTGRDDKVAAMFRTDRIVRFVWSGASVMAALGEDHYTKPAFPK